MHEPAPRQQAPLPDVDDPAALAAWADEVAHESVRVGVRQRHVIEVAEAAHALTLLNTRPLPTWATPKDRHRAWAVLIAGLIITFTTTTALAYLGPDDATALTIFPILCLVWFFIAAYEVTRNLGHRRLARIERNQQIAQASARHAAAVALLEQHEQDHPKTT